MFERRLRSVLSRRLQGLALAATVAALLGVYSGCNSGPRGPLTVPMEFRPEVEPLSGSITSSDRRVYLEPVNDERDNKDEIGKNVQRATPVSIYSSGKTPPEFVHDVLEGELKNFGVDLAESPDAADRVIKVDLTKFWVEESDTFRAEVRAAVAVSDKGGRPVWKGQIAGDGKTFGRSLNPENYQQTLSDATRRAVGNLLVQEQFRNALER